MREQRVYDRAARRSVRRMRHHSGRLIDDDDVVVFVHDRQIDRFGLSRERRPLLDGTLNRVAFGKQEAAFDRLAVDAQIAARRGLSYEGAGGAGAMRDDEIGALAGIIRRGV